MSVNEEEEFNVAEPVMVDVLEQPTVESTPAPLAEVFVSTEPSGGQIVGVSGGGTTTGNTIGPGGF